MGIGSQTGVRISEARLYYNIWQILSCRFDVVVYALIIQASPAAPPSGPSALVASYGGDSDDSEEEDSGPVDESKLTDLSKLACLLCKRRFQTKEILVKHTQMSDLHKVCEYHHYCWWNLEDIWS